MFWPDKEIFSEDDSLVQINKFELCLLTSPRYDVLGRLEGCIFPISSADKHQQKATHEGKKLEMDLTTTKII